MQFCYEFLQLIFIKHAKKSMHGNTNWSSFMIRSKLSSKPNLREKFIELQQLTFDCCIFCFFFKSKKQIKKNWILVIINFKWVCWNSNIFLNILRKKNRCLFFQVLHVQRIDMANRYVHLYSLVSKVFFSALLKNAKPKINLFALFELSNWHNMFDLCLKLMLPFLQIKYFSVDVSVANYFPAALVMIAYLYTVIRIERTNNFFWILLIKWVKFSLLSIITTLFILSIQPYICGFDLWISTEKSQLYFKSQFTFHIFYWINNVHCTMLVYVIYA